MLSGDGIYGVQSEIIAGLKTFATWTQTNLPQAAQLAQQLPVISTSVGDLVDVHDQVTNDLVNPAQAYFKR